MQSSNSSSIILNRDYLESHFQDLLNKRTLGLSYNQIKNIQKGTFDKLVNLKWLHLNNNQINNIQEGTFQGLENLNHLHLENNHKSQFW